MDPEAAYTDFLDALNDGDPEVASHRLDELATWVAEGGFVPARLLIRGLPTTEELARLLTSAAVVLSWAADDLNREGDTT